MSIATGISEPQILVCASNILKLSVTIKPGMYEATVQHLATHLRLVLHWDRVCFGWRV